MSVPNIKVFEFKRWIKYQYLNDYNEMVSPKGNITSFGLMIPVHKSIDIFKWISFAQDERENVSFNDMHA